MEDRIVTNHLLEEEQNTDGTLRPQTLDEYTGQERMKESLRVCIEAAQRRGEPLDHAIFYGPPGLGKTTIAHIIAKEMGGGIRSTSGLVLNHAGDPRRDPGKPASPRRPVHRRNPPAARVRRRSPVPCHGRFSDRPWSSARARPPAP